MRRSARATSAQDQADARATRRIVRAFRGNCRKRREDSEHNQYSQTPFCGGPKAH